jgi:hypothetical protein
MFVERRFADRVEWVWFNSKSMLWMRVYKMTVSVKHPEPWLLTRGSRGSSGYKAKFFMSLGGVIGDLQDHEMDALLAAIDIPPMLLIALSAAGGDGPNERRSQAYAQGVFAPLYDLVGHSVRG